MEPLVFEHDDVHLRVDHGIFELFRRNRTIGSYRAPLSWLKVRAETRRSEVTRFFVRSPKTVPTLVLATHWVPEHLDFDQCRALAVKAIWALGGIPGPEAREALEGLRDDENEIIRENAVKQLARRGEL
ncbi:HEAT repeat domain-containing protein [Streptomyces sp. NPDC018352]|uniref:HEAT repeat domain-containing protein n=1 Tax=Streptomyces sp. NPDC018352 TaxID=3157194 RepID=UPI0033F62C4F